VQNDRDSADYPRIAVGAETGLAFPTTIEALHEVGPEFLTIAFRATGALSEGNRVSAISGSTEFFGGGMGRKLLLTVEYETAETGLDRELFVKFPRDYGDPLREIFTPLMASEVRFALLSRRRDFPLVVPKCYFGDYDPQTMNGVLITSRVPYGQGGIETSREKCQDYELSDALPYYRALARAMGRLAGHHKAGRFGNIDHLFPPSTGKAADSNRIPFPESLLPEKLAKLREFAKSAPQLFQDDLGSDRFLDRFAGEVPLVFALQDKVRAYLAAARNYVALCHTNMNIDNAWFWRGADGSMQVGLLDWGGVAQMSIAQAIYGMTCSGEITFNSTHRRELIDIVVGEYCGAGGPEINSDTLYFMTRLSIAFLGLAWALDAPSIVAFMVPDFALAADRFDPKIRDNFLGRVQTQVLMVFLNEWRDLDIGSALREFAGGRRA
jgi:hypothetical protein